MMIAQDNSITPSINGVSKGSATPSQIAKKLRQQYETDVGVFFAEVTKLPS